MNDGVCERLLVNMIDQGIRGSVVHNHDWSICIICSNTIITLPPIFCRKITVYMSQYNKTNIHFSFIVKKILNLFTLLIMYYYNIDQSWFNS